MRHVRGLAILWGLACVFCVRGAQAADPAPVVLLALGCAQAQPSLRGYQAERALGQVAPPEAVALPQVVSFAPRGTWAVTVLDLDQLRNWPHKFALLGPGMEEAGPRLQEASLCVTVYLNQEPGGWMARRSDFCSVLTLKRALQEGEQQALTAPGSPVTIEGTTAYHDSMRSQVVALVGRTTLLEAHLEQPLAAVLRAYQHPEERGLDDRLSRLLAPLAGSALYGAAHLPQDLRDELPDVLRTKPGSPWSSIEAGAFALDVRDGLDTRLALTMGSAADAQAGLAQATTYVKAVTEATRDELERYVAAALCSEELLGALERIELSAQGPDLHASLSLSGHELDALMTDQYPDLVHVLMDGPEWARSTRAAVGVRARELTPRQIGRAIWMFRSDHGGEVPATLEALVQAGYLGPPEGRMFVIDLDHSPVRRGELGLEYSYEYAGALPSDIPPDTIICYTKRGVFTSMRFVITADGTSLQADEAELSRDGGSRSRSLDASYTAAVKAFGEELTAERDAELRKFYEVED